jgi:hypothetical protein
MEKNYLVLKFKIDMGVDANMGAVYCFLYYLTTLYTMAVPAVSLVR